jgi:tRNA(Ile)-lysidine synthase
MIAPLTQSVRNTIHLYSMVRPGDRIGVAVSGGADSVALLRLLENLRGDLGVTLCVVHFNHQLRLHDSDEDERFVASLARDRSLAFFSGRADVAAAAKQHKWNLEDAARRLRYDFFAKIIADGAATRVATAHTADDQAETVLARLIRGTGLTGLSAIRPVYGGVIRPLLQVRRAQLRAYLSALKQDWREDSTNADTRRLRARVRQQLLPELERDFSRSIVRKLSELADLAQDDEKFWGALIEERCAGIVARTGDTVSIHTRDLLWPLASKRAGGLGARNHLPALTQRIVRHLYASVSARGGELSRRHVQQVIQLAEKGSSGRQLELPRGVRVYKDFARLVFTIPVQSATFRENSPGRPSYAHKIDIPAYGSADVSVPELGRRFHLKVIDWPPQERETTEEGVILDAERLRPPLILRNWTPGDAYCPTGRHGRRKLARMLMAVGVSAAQRILWPVLTSAGRVVWVQGMPVAKEFSTSEATRRGVWIVEDRR